MVSLVFSFLLAIIMHRKFWRWTLTSSTDEAMVQAKGFPPKVLKCTPLAIEAAISGKHKNKQGYTSPHRCSTPKTDFHRQHAIQMICGNIKVSPVGPFMEMFSDLYTWLILHFLAQLILCDFKLVYFYYCCFCVNPRKTRHHLVGIQKNKKDKWDFRMTAK